MNIDSTLYINAYMLYRPSGSITSGGDWVETGSLQISGVGRIEPAGENEKFAAYNFYCDVADIEVTDTLFVDEVPYNVKSVENYFGNHLQIKLDYTT